MATLLVRLCGPMQSWGTRSRFTERDTELEPSKSGVIGLLCAALGRSRDQDVTDLAGLRLGIRVDTEGILTRDYHTAGAPGRDGLGGIARASGDVAKTAVLSNRYYLCDADFLVGLESADEALLSRLEAAVRAPRWQLFLGRKSFVPAVPLHLPNGGLRHSDLRKSLEEERWPLRPTVGRAPRDDSRRLRIVLETTFDAPSAETRMDQPLGAAFQDRQFGPRPVIQDYIMKERTDVPEPAHT